MTKVLMVCLGNICRSPVAEGILRHKAKEAGAAIEVDSAGTSAYHQGEQPDQRSAENALTHGVDIRQQQSRPFRVSDFDAFDRIFAMDATNYSNILALARNAEDEQKVEMLLNLTHPGSNKPVPDPYYGGPTGFQDVYELIDEACEHIIAQHT